MYDINDITNVIISFANDNDVFINQFDMQYLLLILHSVYDRIYDAYLFQNTSTVKSDNPKSYLTAFPEIHDRFAAYGGISLNSDVTKDTKIPIPDEIQARIRTIVKPHLIAKAKDTFYLKKIIKDYIPLTTNKNTVQEAYNTHRTAHTAENCNVVKDADTILKDIVKNTDIYMNHAGIRLINMWLHSNPEERQTIERMFRLLFDETFDTYVCRVIVQTEII